MSSARSSWKGFLKLGPVSIALKAYTTATRGDADIPSRQLHVDCHSPIRYQKTCPRHGEVPQEEIAHGYEFSKGRYVIVDPKDLEKLHTEDDKAITIEGFLSPSAMDPIYFSGKSCYLVPDGPVAQKPYALLVQALAELRRDACGQVVMHGRRKLVLIRPFDGILCLSILKYEDQVVKPAAFYQESGRLVMQPVELDLTKKLIAAAPQEIDLASYADDYPEKLARLVQKATSKRIVTSPVPGPRVR